MIAVRSDFDTSLDRILAMGVNPAVPPDLARRIVVRTTSLPQHLRCEDRLGPEKRKPAEPVSVRRFGRASLPVGAAIAASLLLVLAGPVLPDLPASHSVDLASADGIAANAEIVAAIPEIRAVISPDAARAQSPASRIEAASTQPEVETSPANDGDETRADPPAQDGASTGEMVVAHADLTETRSAMSGFTLAGDPPEALPVYGPVLEPEAAGSHSGLITRSPSSRGVAVASSRAFRSTP